MSISLWCGIKLALIMLLFENVVQCMDPKGISLRKYYNPKPIGELMINKVSLTQKGYIQFLRYITDVPVINEFTFCIWLKSNNLTNNHPILSYSRHEKERYIRAWISPNGKTINMELLDNLIFSVPVKMHTNHWYHICQSWDNYDGTWQLYFNGKLSSQGTESKLRGAIIPSEGDVVVGQEYTDFDKGLDDGIEGDIYGFNFLLASASKFQIVRPLRYTNVQEFVSNYRNEELETDETQEEPTIDKQTVPSILGYFPYQANRMAKGLFTLGEQFLKNMFNFFRPSATVRIRSPSYNYVKPLDQVMSSNTMINYSTKRILNDNNHNEISSSTKPLGLNLIELGFRNCALGKGSPIIDKRLIVSWTKTPVRVFGGALWKPIAPFCKAYKF